MPNKPWVASKKIDPENRKTPMVVKIPMVRLFFSVNTFNCETSSKNNA